MAEPRILTFNFHEPYLCLMAKTGLSLTVGLYTDPALARAWQTQYRPVPPNIAFQDERVWRAELAAGKFDAIIAHNETNALDLLQYKTPKILVCHNRRTFLRTVAKVDHGNVEELYAKLIERLRESFLFVFISESKRADYGVDGPVILPGIDLEEFGGYTGEVPEILRVGNMMRERDLMFDVDFQERVCAGFPNRVAGIDPRIPAARMAESFDDLLHLYRSRRCLLHVTREAYEDGYNLAMLEAMASGMPVVSLSNRTSPLTHGVDGFVSYDADTLRHHIRELFADVELAREIGARGRETVARKFPISAFVEKWRDLIETAAGSAPRSRHKPARAEAPESPLRILMHYVASPFTTGRYFEQAARKRHPVVTTGLRCPEELLKVWGFEEPPPPYAPHDIDLTIETTWPEILARLPKGFEPDLYLWVDSGMKKLPEGMDSLRCPKVCYLIDTHIAPELRIEIARRFDYTFLAQRGQVDLFRQAGVRNVFWLPLACSPELHDLPQLPRVYDVAYVGSIGGDATDRRAALLAEIAARFPNHKIGRHWPQEMAHVYAQSKIVVNACINRDMNMRVFEGMAAGALLVTDEADGLSDLFQDGTHLVVYHRDEEVFDAIARYLEDDDARDRIAAAGTALVREKHTYDLRLQTILDAVLAARRGRAEEKESVFAPGSYYRNLRPELAQFVPPGVERLLDVGCGCGDFARSLKERGVKEVHGIEIVEEAWAAAKQVLDGAILGNIERMDLAFPDEYFDCITFADVLEHLVDPTAVLRKAGRVLAPDGVVLMSIPNVRFCGVIHMLGEGRWRYADMGILDRTHLRFFTAAEMRAMVEEAGLEVLNLQALTCAPETWLPRQADGSVTLGRITLHPADDQDYRDLLTFQYVVVAGKPGADRLAKARAALDIKQNEAALLLAQYAYGADAFEQKRIMATASARMGQLTTAERLYREALELRSADADVTGELGILLVAMNRPAEARDLLESALRADPHNDRARGALGLVYTVEGRAAEALEALQAALEASFEHVGLVPHLIQAAEQLDRLSDIADLVRGYADFYPGNPDLAHSYAALLVLMGRGNEARDRLETLLLLAPNHKPAQELLDRLHHGHA